MLAWFTFHAYWSHRVCTSEWMPICGHPWSSVSIKCTVPWAPVSPCVKCQPSWVHRLSSADTTWSFMLCYLYGIAQACFQADIANLCHQLLGGLGKDGVQPVRYLLQFPKFQITLTLTLWHVSTHHSIYFLHAECGPEDKHGGHTSSKS